MKTINLLLLVFASIFAISQNSNNKVLTFEENLGEVFKMAYQLYPGIPQGMLEAVSFTNTRFSHITDETPPSCTGMPKAYGLMGLILDGKGYFRNNLLTVSELSEVSVKEIIDSPEKHLLAYASAFVKIKNNLGINSSKIEDNIPVLIELSELPISDKNNIGNDYAMNTYLYSILTFLNNPVYQEKYEFPAYNIDLKDFFGQNNYKIFSSPFVIFTDTAIYNKEGYVYKLKEVKTACPDYPVSWCNWVASPNWSPREGAVISAIAIHTVQGTYAGCISWFQNPDANASTHYVLRSSDGQITQMVLEANKAWHVTTENPYTIGYEHEGYVDNPAWYTIAMYQSSADLTRDVCQAYGINTLRTFYRDTLDNGTALDYGLHNLGGEGSCIKIKGHQHFPNQTHTDPGSYWIWNYYFKLINPNPSVTTLTTTSGNFYDSGGPSGNYTNDERLCWLIQPPNAASVTLTFSSFSLEANYDFLYIYDGDNEFAPLIGRFNTQSAGTITSSGGSLFIEFRSDCGTTAAGWVASWTSTQIDDIPPTTSISTEGEWKTADFIATFTDADNTGGSGVEKAFYQVLDYNGTEWRANAERGFFADNFDNAIHPDWTTYAGVWSINNGNLVQSDESSSNTNISAYLRQNLSNRYLFHWVAKMEGSGTNRRAGLHFFCDSASLPNRGNSYFVYFRVDDAKAQIYEVNDDVYTLVANVPYTFNAGQYYDYKVTYDRITGKISVWVDNSLVAEWTDSSPLADGKYISFRSGNCIYSVNELKIYRSRYPSVTVTLGNTTKDIRYQNPNPTTYGAKIKSIVVDSAGNLSAIAYHNLNIDWTPPTCVNVNDGISLDIDTIYDNTTLSANWIASLDANSGISAYWYCIGTSAGDSNIVGWTNNGLNTNFNLSGLNLAYGQTYYVSVQAVNSAGLVSGICTSDGVYLYLVDTALFPIANFYAYDAVLYLPNAYALFVNISVNADSYLWDFGDGTTSTDVNPWHQYTDTGNYTVTLVAISNLYPDDTLIRPNYIHVQELGGINNITNSFASISIYPNPFYDNIYLYFNSSEFKSIDIKLTDIIGREIVSEQISGNIENYGINNLKHLSQGVYFLIIENKSRKMSYILMKE